MKTFHIISLFPEGFSYLEQSIVGRAQRDKKIKVAIYQLRDFTTDKHHTTDDNPYGGGAGMVLKAEPIIRAVDHVRKKARGKKQKVVILSAKGKQFNQKIAYQWAKESSDIIFVSGRYEGIDERVVKALHTEEVSIGPYVLTDGDPAIMAMVSAVARLIPGVIKLESLEEESHWNLLLKKEAKIHPVITTYQHSQVCRYVIGNKGEVESPDAGLEYPHYTRPEVFKHKGKKYPVPKVLLSGNHRKIEEWRVRQKK